MSNRSLSQLKSYYILTTTSVNYHNNYYVTEYKLQHQTYCSYRKRVLWKNVHIITTRYKIENRPDRLYFIVYRYNIINL